MKSMGIDHDALIKQFAQASEKQGESLQQAVQQATLKALQGRELTLKSIKDTLKMVTQAASAGVASSGLAGPGLEPMLSQVAQGMDAALVQAVEANRRALQQIVDQGAQLRETHLKKAVADIEKMEDALFSSVAKSVGELPQSVQGPWSSVLDGMKLKGTATGASATAVVEQLTTQARELAREGRAFAQSSTEAWLAHYATLVSGVLIGMSNGLNGEGKR
ncbi:DUF6781 family protein [Cupriavidus sp. PET2-C1]